MSAVGSDSEGSESEETVTGVLNKKTSDIESLTSLTDATLKETEVSMDVFDGSSSENSITTQTDHLVRVLAPEARKEAIDEPVKKRKTEQQTAEIDNESLVDIQVLGKKTAISNAATRGSSSSLDSDNSFYQSTSFGDEKKLPTPTSPSKVMQPPAAITPLREGLREHVKLNSSTKPEKTPITFCIYTKFFCLLIKKL